MNVKQDRLFPTHTLTIDNLLLVEYLDSMQQDIYHNFKNNPHWREDGAQWLGKNWQSKYDLHTQIKYKPLSNEVIKFGKKYLTDRLYKFDELVITDMWANILRPGETHRPHTHSNNIVSGVFYVKADKASGLVFVDPRPQANVLCPDVSKQNLDNANSVNYDSYTNRMILFPSWLTHYVPVNDTNEDRISIAFNLMCKGKIGSSSDYQSAEF